MRNTAMYGVLAAAVGALMTLPVGIAMIGGNSSGGVAGACNPDEGSESLTPRKSAGKGKTVAGFGAQQLVNAATILKAGKDEGLSARDQTIGVMVAMLESSLETLDRGDAVGPDSRGLFQQRAKGWGSYENRMDPYKSAVSFFKALKKISNRKSLSPTQVGHRVQRNANPNAYTKMWDPAVKVVKQLSGADISKVMKDGTSGSIVCSNDDDSPGTVSKDGWAKPAKGEITSPFGARVDPVRGRQILHTGVDLATGSCGEVIHAAQDGVVSRAEMGNTGAGTIRLDHGGKIQTQYLRYSDQVGKTPRSALSTNVSMRALSLWARHSMHYSPACQ